MAPKRKSSEKGRDKEVTLEYNVAKFLSLEASKVWKASEINIKIIGEQVMDFGQY